MSGSVPPSRFAITAKAPDGAQEPSGRSRTARRCCSNCEVRAPSIVQCPLLCGRIASSFTSSPPDGDRATSAASSRRNGTNSSASSAIPCPSTSAASAGDKQIHTPLPSYPPLTALSTTGHVPPTDAANASTSATEETGAYRGQGAPSDFSRSRIASLSWVYRSAAEPGRTRTPDDSSEVSTEPGTCSWSNVSTSQPAANAATSGKERCEPTTTS